MPILEFNPVNPLTYLGPSLTPNLIVLIGQILVIGGFGMAAYYIVKYLKKFYEERPIPEEWKIFWWAMVWATIHELIEVPILYQWFVGQLCVIFFFIVEIVAGFYLIKGSYLLAKKYQPK